MPIIDLICSGAAYFYSSAREAEKKGNKQEAEYYFQAVKAREAEVVALRTAVEAFKLRR